MAAVTVETVAIAGRRTKGLKRTSRRSGKAAGSASRARLRQLVAEQLRGEPVDPREPDKKKDDEPPQ